jgi:hypothetical protein
MDHDLAEIEQQKEDAHYADTGVDEESWRDEPEPEQDEEELELQRRAEWAEAMRASDAGAWEEA